MTVEYTEDIEKQILSHLDGWKIKVENIDSNNAQNETQGEVSPFIEDITEYADNPNKKISSEEVQNFYELALQKAYSYTNRLNVTDLSNIEEQRFIDGVCLWTASDLWNKYNIRVNNEDMEDTYIQSYGGLLYKQGITILNSFINQRITTFTSLKKKNEQCNNNWIL